MLSLLIASSLLRQKAPDPIAQAGFDPAAVKRLVDRCSESGTLHLVVLKDGKTVIDEGFKSLMQVTNLMSATKSITSMAVGCLLDEGKIASIDTPISKFFPEYTVGEKANETVRNFIEHTSGIKNYDDSDNTELLARDSSGKEAYKRVERALAAPIESAPGTYFRYSNRGVDLLSGVVRKAAGEPMDEYLSRKIFEPLGIKKPLWFRDSAGDPHGSAELLMSATSMAKLGQLMLDKGMWQGKRLLSEKYVDQATTPSAACADYEPCGWLWWLVDPWFTLDDHGLKALADAKIPSQMIEKLKPLKGRRWPSQTMMFLDMMHAVGGGAEGNRFQNLYVAGSLDFEKLVGKRKGKARKPVAFYADGWGGQYIFVLPAQHIVAVRLCSTGDWDADPSKYEMGDFYPLVRALVK